MIIAVVVVVAQINLGGTFPKVDHMKFALLCIELSIVDKCIHALPSGQVIELF